MRTSRVKTPQPINAFTARTHLGQLLKQVSEKGATYIVTRKGKPKAVIVGVKEYEDLLEVLAEQHDREFQKALRESARQIKKGEITSIAALRAIYRKR